MLFPQRFPISYLFSFPSIAFLFSSLILLLLFRALWQAYSPKRTVAPGPFFAKFSRLWFLRQVLQGEFEKVNIELHCKYGPVVRIAPNEYSISDPEAIKTIFGHGTQFMKAPSYKAAGDPYFPNLFTELDPPTHATLRRKFAPLYSMSSIVSMEPCVQKCTAVLTERLREFAQSGAAFNLQEWLQFYAFDLIGLLAVSESFGFLDDGKDPRGILIELDAFIKYSARVGIYHEIHTPLYKLMQTLGKGGAYIYTFTWAQIAKRLPGSATEEKGVKLEDSILARALEKHKEDPETFKISDVYQVCLASIGAGSDTTSISLCAIFWYLLKTPRALAKLKEEVDEMTTSGKISHPVTFLDAQAMPYMQAVIKEAIRLHSATGLPLGRVVPKGGAKVAGKYFTEGSVVGINTWVAHYNTDMFGDDAATFRPERWLEDKEKAQVMERYYIAFGHGSRTCVGKNISLMEISVLVPNLIRRFEFELVRPEDGLECYSNWFVKHQNVLCRVSERKV
ncbi:cytochrome P450 [Delitschia confertaspora ATCC 74209]|uniref:Cytochrome P450 n=1 Tax=Delitschia confertaspora ATCC 74209 TaxID=1513339 RepID=A0A9P4JGD7_9PLEO|nr:cytochrome P450 [Delitschia confertaspora ATCC 74209]